MRSSAPAAEALIDSNVIVAALVEQHEHHVPSVLLLNSRSHRSFAVAAHSLAEAFNILTRRRGEATFGFDPRLVWSALDEIAASVSVLALAPSETLDAIRSYAQGGGVGPRLDDRLIGETAVRARIPCLITWNTSHMRSLFQALEVVSPADHQAVAPK